MPVSEALYERVALEDPEGSWELVCGQLRRKPAMTAEHNDIATLLTFELQRQLPLDDYTVRMNSTRTRLPGGTNFVPDVVVVPTAFILESRGNSGMEAYTQPLPLVAEVWSPSTGDYDVTEKLAGYRTRGDREVWLIHPQRRTLTSWVRTDSADYPEAVYPGTATVTPVAFAGVAIVLDSLLR